MLHLVNYKCLNHTPDSVWGQMFQHCTFIIVNKAQQL